MLRRNDDYILVHVYILYYLHVSISKWKYYNEILSKSKFDSKTQFQILAEPPRFRNVHQYTGFIFSQDSGFYRISSNPDIRVHP